MMQAITLFLSQLLLDSIIVRISKSLRNRATATDFRDGCYAAACNLSFNSFRSKLLCN